MRCHRLLHTCTGKTQTKHWDASVDYSCRLNPYFEGWTSDNGVQRACPGATFLIFMPSQLYFNTNFSIGCPIPIQMPKIVALSPPPLPQLCTSLQHISKALRYFFGMFIPNANNTKMHCNMVSVHGNEKIMLYVWLVQTV